MELATSYVAKEALRAFLLPPGCFILGLILGGLLWRSRLGKLLFALSIATLYGISTPMAASWLMTQVESPPLSQHTRLHDIDAIVCLGGGKRFGAIDMPLHETVNDVTLARLRYTARIYRQISKPILVSGGAPAGGIPEAQAMRESLEKDFLVPVRWIEDKSSDTRDNAQMSAAQLLPDRRNILLVSSAFHMPRAKRAFEQAGFKVTTAATDYTNREPRSALSLLPRPSSLYSSSIALREMIGSAWYRLRE